MKLVHITKKHEGKRY